MKPRFAVALMVLTCVAVLAWPTMGDPPKAKPGPQDVLRQLQTGVRVAHQLVEVMDKPLLSAQIAIMRIKDLAVKTKKLDMGIELLWAVAKEADEPPVRRAALFALADLHEAAGNPAEAMEALASACMPRPGRERRERAEARERGRGRERRPEMPEEGRRVCHWLREHPDLARRIIRNHFPDMAAPGPRPPMGQPGPSGLAPQALPRPGHRDVGASLRRTVEMLRAQLAIAAQRAAPPPGGPSALRLQPGPPGPDERAGRGAHMERQADQLRAQAKRLESINRQLEEKAGQLDRMHEQLKRRARELEKLEKRRPRHHDDDDDDDD